MARKALIAISLAFLLAAAGCAKGAPENKPGADSKKEKAAVENKERNRPPAGSNVGKAPSEKVASGEAPEIIIRTDNRVSNQEAGAMLDEVDRQLTELLNTLDRLNEVDDQDLKY